ncbi:hypothetical protein ABEB36_010384 [Hypothenemus hampei]|uniref:Uncharacterized protein n=1 Tax=Hypothenemus hampei TaxID=57062 RepID=A0ABD1EJZ8_HYPHA
MSQNNRSRTTTKIETAKWTTMKRPSDHIIRLAQPKKNFPVTQGDGTQKPGKKSTIKYKLSKRILNLAKPKYVNTKKLGQTPVDPLTESITTVSPSALLYKPTKRILELAQPK